MSGGSYGYKFCEVDDYYVGAMYDEELNEMMKDLVKVLHDVEWWQSSDIGEDSYRKTVKEFKDKWFNSDRSERLKPIIDRRINEVRTELINMIGGDSE
jgi:hypothetical protein